VGRILVRGTRGRGVAAVLRLRRLRCPSKSPNFGISLQSDFTPKLLYTIYWYSKSAGGNSIIPVYEIRRCVYTRPARTPQAAQSCSCCVFGPAHRALGRSSRPRRRTSTVVRRIADFYLDLDYSKYLSSDGPITSPVIHKNMKRMYSRFT